LPRLIPQVRILTSPEALAKARADGEAYAIRNPPPAVSLERLGRSRLEWGALAGFARAGEPLVHQLREIASTSGAPAAAACVCLMRLGHPELGARLSEWLETSPSIGEFFKWVGMNGDLVRALPDLEPLRRQAVQIAQTPDHHDRLPALQAAFEIGEVLATTDIVQTLVRAEPNGSRESRLSEAWRSSALARIVLRGGEPGLAAARALLQPPFIDRRSAGNAGRLRDPRILPDIERALSSGPKKDVHSGLLLAVAFVQGAKAVPRLLDALDDPELTHAAANALGIAAEDTGDEALVAALTMAAAGQGSGEHAMAVARIGGPLAMRTLAGLYKRGTTFDAMYCHWRAKGITAASAIRRFVDAGVIPAMPSDTMLSAASESGYTAHHDVRVFWHFVQMSGHLVDALGEDGGAAEAARHPILIERFADATAGKLPIEHVSQIEGPKNARDERELEIQFVWSDRVYQVTTTTFMQAFDFVAVRTLLNEALRDRGRPERFTPVRGQNSETLLFGPQADVEAACDDLWLPHGSSALADVLHSQERQQMFFLQQGGDVGKKLPHDAAGVAFHIFSSTRAGPFPHDAVNDVMTRARGSADSISVTTGAGWTEIVVSITRDQFMTAGAEAIESLFVSVCDTTAAHFGRTLCGGDWARITEGELCRSVDALDWLQYFGPRFGVWLRGRSPQLTARKSPLGAEVVKLDIDPLAPSWQSRKTAARRISLLMRPFPPSAQEELDPATRLKRVSPPEPVAWRPGERQAMLRARAGTLKEIERGMANGRLFDRFRRRYLAEELESSRLDRMATWLQHYGALPATAAFRGVARVHDARPAAGPMDDIALEGCVKIVAWGGEDRPVLERELLMEHLVDPENPGNATMAREFPDRDAVAGMVRLVAEMVTACPCGRCIEVRKILGKGNPPQ
jgi:hypothetical protein